MRKILGIAILSCCAAILPADQESPQFIRPITGDQAILHALDRLTFGPRPGDVEMVKEMGLRQWIDLQLHPERIPQDPELAEQIQSLGQASAPGAFAQRPENSLSPRQANALRRATAEEDRFMLSRLPEDQEVQVLAAMPLIRQRVAATLSPELQEKVRAAARGTVVDAIKKGAKQAGQKLAQAKFYRAVESSRQLEEVLTDFWFNHFNVDAGKGADRILTAAYERDVIRPHVLGKFRDLLEATANSPAMMFYLDNWQSTAVDVPVNRSRPGKASHGLNENYGRELMELHTLGVDGGYTQKDVTEVARCFTGWSIQAPRLNGPFVFRDAMHDQGEKMVLGVRIPAGGGKSDGERVLDILARHPATAQHISRELAQRFVADDPPQPLVDRMAKTFRDTDGDLRAVLEAMFSSPEFFSQGAYRAKIKSPFEMMVSALRATGATIANSASLAARIATLGEPLYRKVEPTGYSNAGSDWINSAALVERMNFAMDLAANRVDGVNVDSSKFPAEPARAARQLLFTSASQQTLDAIGSQSDPAVVAGMLLGSPDFQRR